MQEKEKPGQGGQSDIGKQGGQDQTGKQGGLGGQSDIGKDKKGDQSGVGKPGQGSIPER